MSPPIPEPDVTPPLFDSFSSTPSVPELPSQEASLEDSTVEQDLPSEQPIETTYHLVLKGTIRGNTKLVTNTGYTFNIRKRRPNGTIDWQCTVSDTDECSEAPTKMNKCHPNASCINTQGSYNCSCDPAYNGDGWMDGFNCKGTFIFCHAFHFMVLDRILIHFCHIFKYVITM